MRLCSLLFLTGLTALGQSQSFDTYTYDAAPGYTFRAHTDSQEWVKIDQKRRTYCAIYLYRSQPSLPSAGQDIDAEWKSVVVSQVRDPGTPITRELPLPHAPTSLIRGSESIDRNGNKSVMSLFVIRFPGRYAGVLFSASNAEASQSCQEDITTFVTTLRMAMAGGSAAAPVSSATAAPTRGTIAGSWRRVIASRAPMTYNAFTKAWEYNYVAALRQFKQVYIFRFETNGQYTYELDAEDYNRSERTRIIERGNYTISAGVIQFEPKQYQDGKGPRNQDPPLTSRAVPVAHSRRFSIGEHPNYKDSAGLQLQTSDGWETYKPVN